MKIDTNLHGRLRNTSLPASNGILPLFEAVANSIHAIEDAGLSSEEGRIRVQIFRDEQMTLAIDDRKRPGREPEGDIVAFEITDNGIGFTDENMRSFLTLDSEHKASRGGRGVGRLIWLKAFERATIESVYQSESGEMKRRRFTFDAKGGVSGEIIEDASNTDRRTSVRLEGFSKRYRQASPKTSPVLARSLFEHNLWYFIRPGGAPVIEVVDNAEEISLDKIYEEQMVASSSTDSFDLKGERFDLIHVRLSTTAGRTHSIAYCASNRVVTQEPIKGKIPGLYGALSDGQREFIYECYVSSPLLDDKVRSERTSFDIEEDPLELFESAELSKSEILDAVLARVSGFLSSFLEEKKRLGKERISDFVSAKAPRYRPILGRIPDAQLIVDPDISDKDLDVLLHRQLMEIEARLLSEGHEVMMPKENEEYESYSSRLQEYLQTAEDIKKSDLANYVAHRRVILDLLEKAIQRKDDGRYAREDLIHNLIMPMGTTSDEVHFDSCNLWVLDERLAFHDYLASDKTLSAMPITGSEETKEPDLISFNVFDNPILISDRQSPPLASITIVELKRPMRNDAAAGEDKDPIEQALGYLERIRKGNAMTKSGRLIPQSENIPGFCYAICDITPTIERRCKLLGLTPTSDYSGYFGYNANFKAYIEVISFDRLVSAAKERNKAFFDRLGLPTK